MPTPDRFPAGPVLEAALARSRWLALRWWAFGSGEFRRAYWPGGSGRVLPLYSLIQLRCVPNPAGPYNDT